MADPWGLAPGLQVSGVGPGKDFRVVPGTRINVNARFRVAGDLKASPVYASVTLCGLLHLPEEAECVFIQFGAHMAAYLLRFDHRRELDMYLPTEDNAVSLFCGSIYWNDFVENDAPSGQKRGLPPSPAAAWKWDLRETEEVRALVFRRLSFPGTGSAGKTPRLLSGDNDLYWAFARLAGDNPAYIYPGKTANWLDAPNAPTGVDSPPNIYLDRNGHPTIPFLPNARVLLPATGSIRLTDRTEQIYDMTLPGTSIEFTDQPPILITGGLTAWQVAASVGEISAQAADTTYPYGMHDLVSQPAAPDLGSLTVVSPRHAPGKKGARAPRSPRGAR